MKKCRYEDFWAGPNGDKYTKRNDTLTDVQYFEGKKLTIIKDFLSEIPRDASILEIGCNQRLITGYLKDLGFTDIHGIDINQGLLLGYQRGRPSR